MNKERVLATLRKMDRPVSFDEIAAILKELELQEVEKFLKEMEKSGRIILNRKNKYCLPEMMNLYLGRLQGNAKGYAFLIPDDPEAEDVFIKADNLNGAMNRDRVLVRVFREGLVRGTEKREGEVVRILERANTRIVGRFEKEKSFAFVVPDDPRINKDVFIPKRYFNKAQNNDKVVVEITRWPAQKRNPEGKVIENLGPQGAAGVDILSIIRNHELPEDFPAPVLREAKRVAKLDENDYIGRRDIRDWSLVTIDGVDAKDLDDAVSLKQKKNGNWLLGVHIADVSHYVKENKELDQEAFERGTSVYLADRVIPMLPPALSNDICSLNAGKDRLALSCVMEIDGKGQVVDHEIFNAVIKVKERMSYRDVNKILKEKDENLILKYKDLENDFQEMARLQQVLQSRRETRGALNFNFPEAKVILDETGAPIRIEKRVQDIAEKIIEEFMLLANETVAEDFFWREVPFLFRVHEPPYIEKIIDLNEFLERFGYHLRGDLEDLEPYIFKELIEKVKGRPEERLINTVVLRSMRHAIYHAECLGHFGLAAKYYTHFTSPIRRYPDLIIHRIIKASLASGGIGKKKQQKLAERMPLLAEQASLREQIAEEAERDTLDLKKAEYMKRHLGDVFAGIVSGVTSYGIFVELENTVEGLVHVSTLSDDYYDYDEKMKAMIGRRKEKSYKLADPVSVKVVGVNLNEGKVDFEMQTEV